MNGESIILVTKNFKLLNYIMQSTIQPNLKPRISSTKFILISSVIISVFTNTGCNDSGENNSTGSTDTGALIKAPAAPITTNYLYGCSLSKTEFENLLKNRDLQGNTAKLILRLFSKNLWASDMKFEVMAHPTKNHSLDDGLTPIYLPLIDTIQLATEGDTIYVFGNSEVNIKKMRNLVERGNSTIDYNHFVFYPVVGKLTRNIIFKIYPVKADGTLFDKASFITIDTEIFSNPSPPKKPTAVSDPEYPVQDQ